MAYRDKTYVAFDADNDIRYYYLTQAWKQNDNSDFNFFDAHNIRPSREWSSGQTIKRILRERLKNSRMFVCPTGESTRYLKKVRKVGNRDRSRFGNPPHWLQSQSLSHRRR